MHTQSRFFLLLTLAMLLLTSCSKSLKDQPDPFFDTWKEKAAQSMGHSPEQTFQETTIEESVSDNLQENPEIAKETPLPTIPVTIKVNQVPARVIIDALAQKAGLNILGTDNIKGTITLHIQNAPWDQVFKSILGQHGCAYEWEGSILRIMTYEDVERDANLAKQLLEKKGSAKQLKQFQPIITKVVKIKYAEIFDLQGTLISALGGKVTKTQTSDTDDDKDEEDYTDLGSTEDEASKKASVSIEDARTENGNVFVDVGNNALVLQARQEKMEMLLKLIKILDKPARQIHLKAYIVEATKNVGRDLGVQWGGSSTRGDLTVSGAADNNIAVNFPSSSDINEIGGAGINLIGQIDNVSLDVELTALEEAGKLNILSSPSISTLDNKLAFTESGEDIPYVTYDDDGNAIVDFQTAVLRLEITPHIIDKVYLKMAINIKKDEVDFSQEVEGNPLIQRKQTKTTLVVANKETIVISGLTKQTNSDSSSGLPGLKDVPGLKYLFGAESKSEKMEELLIFITPTVLPQKSEINGDKITREEIEQLRQAYKTPHPVAKEWEAKSRTMLTQKNADEAIRLASIAIGLAPGFVEAYVDRARGYIMKNNFQQAYDDSNIALLIAPTNDDAALLKGISLENNGQTADALKYYEQSCGFGNAEGCANHKRLFYKNLQTTNTK